MGKTVRLEGRPLTWARDRFARYYATTDVPPPPRFARREFAAFPFSTETMMRRHASFRSAEELHEYLGREAPRHVYYSSAYYRFPDHPTMPGKEWLGADVIFDLDADHLRGAESLDYAGQLGLVRERVRSLLDDFLFGDFGIDPAKVALVFSGGRGYHVHVQDESFWTLSSPERRELVDYVTGSGFDARRVISSDRGSASSVVDDDAEGPSRRPSRPFARLPRPDAPGWAGRTSRAVVAMLERFDREGKEEAAAELVAAGLTPTKARRLAKLLVEEGAGRKVRESLSLEVRQRELPPEFLDVVIARAAVEMQGETDAPVTTDIHRLIRLPGSLHGGTGFRVVPLAPERLMEFDPFAVALPEAPGTDRATVRLTESVQYPFPAAPLDARAGEERELPGAVALFLLLRGEAELRP
ncbi:MAG TPA: DNA primase small subunit PriS [Thermoplasmata archaeon]|jgi:DNA primase small subunit|nr:DNA primase small subunit PriS [Thermoplasmata archaeon]